MSPREMTIPLQNGSIAKHQRECAGFCSSPTTIGWRSKCRTIEMQNFFLFAKHIIYTFYFTIKILCTILAIK